MKNSKLLLIAAIIGYSLVLYACAGTSSVARVHPEEVKGLPNCSECHTDSWGALNHKAPDFMLKHKNYANSKFACAACHKESFCADCHAHREEIKPSDKFADSPERSLPHRGDFMSSHKIVAKADPSSCFRCHGRTNNEGCKSCHR